MSCLTCAGQDCLDDIANRSNFDLYSLNEGQLFFNDNYCFVLACPEGYTCTGPYPRTICIAPRTLPPIIVNNGRISIMCCQRTLFATVPDGTSGPQLQAIVQDLFAQCARQQAYCISVGTGPGNNPPPRRNPGGGSNNPLQFQGAFGKTCVGAPYSASVRLVGGNGPLLFGLVSGQIPPGLLPQSGADGVTFMLTGIPTQTGAFTFVISAQDGNGATLNKQFTVNIWGISNLTSLPPAVENTPYSQQLNAVGGTAPYNFLVVSGTIPGITLSSSGLLSGTPDYATAGNYPITVRVTDAIGMSCTATVTFRINLRPGPDWTKLVWDLYGTGQGTGSSSASGSAAGNVATGNVSLVNQAGGPFPHITPVHASIPGGYTGPQVTARMRLTVSYSGNSGVTSVMQMRRAGIQIGGNGCTAASGVIEHDIVVPVSVGASIEIQDNGGGAEWAELNFILTTGSLSFTLVIFNL